jgi:hypothetical protein
MCKEGKKDSVSCEGACVVVQPHDKGFCICIQVEDKDKAEALKATIAKCCGEAKGGDCC